MAAARTGRFDGIVALGCIIKGETSHDQHIAQAVAHGLTNVTLLTDVPVAFGVLTTNNAKQARERAGLGKDPSANKGHEAMTAVLDTITAARIIHHPELAAEIAAGGGLAPRPDKAARGGRRR
jgi:6,7-dimethyl-8-ribityllumazine synthase